MHRFIEKHQKKITGVISVFDRIILKGYLPISYPQAAESFFARTNRLLMTFKDFTSEQTDIVRTHAMQTAKPAKAGELQRSEVRGRTHLTNAHYTCQVC
jgi:hypothetical protein